MPNHLSHIEKPSFLWHIRSWEDIQAASRFTLANYLNVILLIVFVFLAIRQAKVKQVRELFKTIQSALLPSPARVQPNIAPARSSKSRP